MKRPSNEIGASQLNQEYSSSDDTDPKRKRRGASLGRVAQNADIFGPKCSLIDRTKFQ